MQITNDYASTLDLFGTESTSANKTEEEQSGTTLFGLDGDSVTISDEARQLYAQQSASGEASAHDRAIPARIRPSACPDCRADAGR